MDASARVHAAVEAIRRELKRKQQESRAERPVIKRKLSTLVHAAGYEKATASLRRSLAESLELAGLHVFPDVDDQTVGKSAFVRIGLHPFPPETMLFEKETHLARFVEASLGVGSLSRLSVYMHTDGRSGREFHVGGRFVDLLCKENLGRGDWGLVAMEFKKSAAPRGTLTQLGEYLKLLAKEFPERPVRGVVVSSAAASIDQKVLGTTTLAHPIHWLRYKVSIDRVCAVTAGREAESGL